MIDGLEPELRATEPKHKLCEVNVNAVLVQAMFLSGSAAQTFSKADHRT